MSCKIYKLPLVHGSLDQLRIGSRTIGCRFHPALLDGAHQQLGGPLVLVWDNSTQHVDTAMRALIATRSWLTVFRLPPYAPDLNPVEGVWSHLKRSLGNLAARSTDQLAILIKTRLKQMQYRPDLLNGFLAETGLNLEPP